MCGVAAIFAYSGRGIANMPARVQAMNDAQAHRGPDGAGVWSMGAHAAVGHRRLRVVDVSPLADQPFRDAAADAPVLSYNGEIYNAPELRAELRAQGHLFRTSSDTEVLYRALLHWGSAAISHLRGMYAFVYYDPNRAQIWVARDRIGIKPLVYAERDGALVLASECSGLLASGLVDPALDPHAVYQVARLNHLLGTRTALAQAQSVAPGCLYQWDLRTGALSIERLFDVAARLRDKTEDHGSERTFAGRARTLDQAFASATATHLQADIPIGLYLSGGIDSSGLAAQVAQSRDITTYSLLFPNAECDEAPAIAQMTARLGLRNTRVSMSSVSFDEYLKYVRHAEMPQLWTTDLALMKLAAAARAGGDCVVLSGEGPDELFAGYDAYRWMQLRRRMPSPIKRLLMGLGATSQRRLLGNWFSADTSLIQFYLKQHAQAERDNATQRYGFYPENIATWQIVPQLAAELFVTDFAQPQFALEASAAIRQAVGGGNRTTHSANVLFELAVRLPNWVLHMSDRMSAAEGVELRVPYLDDTFVDCALQLSDSDRLRGLVGKRILRQMHKHRLPRSARMRGKVPLYTPISEWIPSFFADARFHEYLAQPSAYFEPNAVQTIAAAVRDQAFASMADKLAKEWALLLVLSTNILAAHWQAAARSARERLGSPRLPEQDAEST